MYVAFNLLMALFSTRAGRFQAGAHYIVLNPHVDNSSATNLPVKSPSPPVSI